jgi:membrane protease YdiL (CAAX protease family)
VPLNRHDLNNHFGRKHNMTQIKSAPARPESDNPVLRLIRSHPLISFVILAYAFSWALIPVLGDPLGSGPFFAALVVLSITKGRQGIMALFRQMTKWRVNWKWYAAAIGFPAGAAVIAALATVWLGAPRPTGAQIALWTEVPITFLLVLLVPMFGPWEEPGFRGFALSKLMNRRSPLVAGLAVGVIHIGWHTPLFFTGDIPMADVVFIIAASIVFAWMIVGTRGSVLLAMIMHATSNAVSGEYISPMFLGADGELLGWIRSGIWVVIAAVVVIAANKRFRSAPSSPTQMETLVAR